MSNNVEVIATRLGLDENAALMHETAVEKGFWPDKYYEERPSISVETGAEDISTYTTYPVVTEEAISTKLALVHSEVTEVLEAVRKDQGEYKQVEEMADIIIRTLDLYAALRNTGQVTSSLDEVVTAKMLKNSGRPRLHGNKF